MATTRSFISLGVFATDANTVIPGSPVTGTAYRNEGVTIPQNEGGEEYNTPPNSADFNQKMFTMSSFTDTIDRHGIPGWSDEVDYVLPSMVWGDDDNFYFALQPSGPAGVGAQDPVTSPTYWRGIGAQTVDEEGSRLIGHTGATVASFLPVASVRVDGSGNLTQNLNFASSVKNGTGDFILTFTNTQPSVEYSVLALCDIQNAPIPNTPHVVNVFNKTVNTIQYRTWEVTGSATLQDVEVNIMVFPSAQLP